MAVQDKRGDVLKFIARYRLTFPNGLDPDGALSARFKISAHPIAVYISPTGEIVGTRIGGVNEKQLKADFERLFF